MTPADVLSGVACYSVACARAEDFADSLPEGCVNLLVLDPPYFGMKDEEWDRAWPNEGAFLRWVGEQCVRWKRVLAPNGSLYVFASPQMGARVEMEVRQHFSVLNHIVWKKENDPGFDGWKQKCSKRSLRQWYDYTERVIFAEHLESFGPVLKRARLQAGLTAKDLAEKIGAHGRVNNGGSISNWEKGHKMPTPEQYRQLSAFLDLPTWDNFLQNYRRPFEAHKDLYMSVWEYPTVRPYPGKHPCEKPHDMARDIVNASSRTGDVVCDFFVGSGRFLEWAVKLGRRAIGCDMSDHWATVSRERCAAAVSPNGAPSVLDSLVMDEVDE